MASSAEAMVTLDPAELGGEAGETVMEEEVSARAPPGAAVWLTQPPGRGASTEAFGSERVMRRAERRESRVAMERRVRCSRR